MALTQLKINRMSPGAKRIEWDMNGLGVRITPTAVVFICDYTAAGKRTRRVLGPAQGKDCLSLQEARALAAERRSGIFVDEAPKRAAPKLSECWERMMKTSALHLAPATVDSYQKRGQVILDTLGEKRIDAITDDDARRVVFGVNGERNRTYVHTLLRMVINWAIKNRILEANHWNPTRSISKREMADKNKVPQVREISLDDLAAFGRTLAEWETAGKVSPWLAGLFRLSLLCALRPGEARTLQWSDVDIARGSIIVRGKTGARRVYLSKESASVLESLPKIQGIDWVFPGKVFGEPIASPYKMLHKVQDAAGVPRFRPYDFRHTAATGALVSGSDLRAVQDLLGHADIATTAKYLHASDDRRKTVAAMAGRKGAVILPLKQKLSG
jgi:integrase